MRQTKACGIWVVDMQEELFSHVDRSHEVLQRVCFVVEAACLLGVPLLVTEQYPEGLGATLEPIQSRLPKEQKIYHKTTFSGMSDPEVNAAALAMEITSWVLIGIETHICLLQTAKELLSMGHEVTVLNDATTSRSMFDFSSALGELREEGARISSSETLIYEWIGDARADSFKKILPLIKAYA